jgi:hypothetical protein
MVSQASIFEAARSASPERREHRALNIMVVGWAIVLSGACTFAQSDLCAHGVAASDLACLKPQVATATWVRFLFPAIEVPLEMSRARRLTSPSPTHETLTDLGSCVCWPRSARARSTGVDRALVWPQCDAEAFHRGRATRRKRVGFRAHARP